MGERTSCIIVGGGPAGMVAGLLLARCGVPVTVFEKHRDFLRDFRGDTIHPSTLLLLGELGLMAEFEKIGYSKVTSAEFPSAGGKMVTVSDFARIRHPYPYIAMAPQWDFLDLLARAGEAEKNFDLRMSSEVTEVLIEADRIVGVRYDSADGSHEMRALLTIAADGRWSRMRAASGVAVKEYPVPLDVWWFRISGQSRRKESLAPAFSAGRAFVLIPRADYVQAAMLIPKGSDGEIRAQGIQAFRRSIAEAAPELAPFTEQVELEDAKFLDVKLNRAQTWWRRGLLCIGDSAHAMSPVGGVGVNLAVQDAVAAARILAGPLLAGEVTERDLAAVQRRRLLPTLLVQSAQRILHVGISRLMRNAGQVRLPRAVALVLRLIPQLTAIPARLLGVGIFQETIPKQAQRPSGK